MGSKTKRLIIRRMILAVLAVLSCVVAFDYISYHARNRRAMAVVADLEGRAGSLLGWPMGKEYIVTFSRPLTDEELKRLSVLNSLAGRDYVAVAFKCDLTPQQLATARQVLSECRVYQPEARLRERR